jgi:2-(1,2-epoxy-1,2-dihydrophenyl)acetyl-CoA isomerase
MYQTILYDVQDRVATITLNRPDNFNSLNNLCSAELIKALKHARADDGVRVIVITGAGDRVFCSGQDLKDVHGVPRSLGESVATRYNPMTELIINTEKPVIARVNGAAAGAGAGIALAADLTICADHAYFLFAFINIGLIMDSGSSYTLPRLVGRQKAFELATLGERLPAQQALDLGMIYKVVSKEELDDATYSLARTYAEKAPKALGLIKRMLNRSLHSSLAEMLDMEMHSQEIAGQSSDYIEGVSAFIEKRKPNFMGK